MENSPLLTINLILNTINEIQLIEANNQIIFTHAGFLYFLMYAPVLIFSIPTPFLLPDIRLCGPS